jgi:hypothetical protein
MATLRITAASGNQVTLVIDKGVIGPMGPMGEGVPPGGNTGQVLIKASDANFDTVWQTLSGMTYQGTWNANNNTPALASGVGITGGYYIVNVGGNTDLDGITDWKINDWAIFNGTVWQKIDNTDTVTSVNSKTGAVVLYAADVGAPGTNGSGASGVWDIDISGTAADATYAATAGSAATATTANSANTAGTANHATTADSATNADSAATLSATLPLAKGGTGQTAIGNAGQALISDGAGLSAWGTPGLASRAYDIMGGTANSILYQNGVDSTHYITPPTAGDTYLKYDGANFVWATAGGGSSLTGFTQSTTPFKTALGASALTTATGINNTAVGYQSGVAVSTGNNNTFMGFQCGDAITTGIGNTAIGANTFGAASTAQYSVAIGLNAALAGNGSNNIIIGTNAGGNAATNSNIFLGTNAGNSPTQATAGECIGIGSNSLSSQNSSVGTVAIGVETFSNLGVGGNNTAVGYFAGNAATGGNGLTFVGFNAGKAVTTANYNTMVGSNAGAVTTTGANNTFLGSNAGTTNVIGANNTYLGFEAGKLNTNSLNTYVGARAGSQGTGGSNTIVGASATSNLTSGFGNTLIGVGAGINISTGNNNTVVGNFTMPAGDSSNYVVLADGLGDLAVMFNDPGAMSFDGINYGTAGQVLQSNGTTGAPAWAWGNKERILSINNNTNLTADYSTYFISPVNPSTTLTLPSPGSSAGLSLTIKRTDSVSAGNTVTLTTPNGQIDNNLNLTIGLLCSYTVTSDGTNWWIVSSYVPPVVLATPVLLSTMGGDGVAIVSFDPVEGATDYIAEVTPK